VQHPLRERAIEMEEDLDEKDIMQSCGCRLHALSWWSIEEDSM